VLAASDPVEITVGAGCPQAPYLMTPAAIPGTVEAENYDLGGQGVAYDDADASNNGGAYRPAEGVDLEVVQRLPFGGHTRRIAGDDLDDVSLDENVAVVARGWPRDILFGAGLSSDELEWLEHELCLAIAGRSARS
jgi:hypothetical protein